MRSEALLKRLYYDLKSPGSYGGVERLLREALKKDKRVTRAMVESFLKQQVIYTRHKKIVNKFPNRKVIQSTFGKQWQIDLIVYLNLKKINKGYGYIMVAIDVFSRKMYAVPMKTKQSESIINALSQLFRKVGKVPVKIQSDKESGLYAKKTRDFLQKKKVILFSTQNDKKASIVERAIRTIRTRLQQYMNYNSTKMYVTRLDDIVDNYNNTLHRSIGMTPNEVNKKNSKQVYEYQYGKYLRSKVQKAVFKLGDVCRIAKYKHIFKKGYKYNFTKDLFYISNINKTNPVTYNIKYLNDDEDVIGTFYKQELSHYTGK